MYKVGFVFADNSSDRAGCPEYIPFAMSGYLDKLCSPPEFRRDINIAGLGFFKIGDGTPKAFRQIVNQILELPLNATAFQRGNDMKNMEISVSHKGRVSCCYCKNRGFTLINTLVFSLSRKREGEEPHFQLQPVVTGYMAIPRVGCKSDE